MECIFTYIVVFVTSLDEMPGFHFIKIGTLGKATVRFFCLYA